MPPQQAVMPRRRSLETISVWALIATLIVSLFILIPSAAIPFVSTKTFALAAGALITLALYILARLSRGNVILPPWVLVGALWLPPLAYILSAVFSGGSFGNALWGTALEQDTLGFMLVAAFLGTLTALIVRRVEHYRTFLAAAAWALGALVVLEVLVVVVGQFAPATISPSFSLVGSYEDLALVVGLGVISVLLALRFFELTEKMRRGLMLVGVLGLFLLALANASLVWILVALVALGLFVEAVMRRRSMTPDADLEDVTVVNEGASEMDTSTHSLVLPLVVLAISLFFLIGGTLGSALANGLHVSVLNVRPSWQSTLAVAHKTYSSSPIFGSGPGTFGTEWLKYRDASLNSTVFWNVDFASGIGFIPTSAVTTGLFGLLAWLAFIGIFVFLGVRMLLRRAPQDPFVRSVAILSFVATLYLLVAAVFDLPSAVVLALTFVFAGLFASTMRFATGGGQWGVIFGRSPRIGFVIVFSLTLLLLASVVAAYTLAERYLAAIELSRANTALAAGNLDAAEAAASKSLSFAPTTAAYQVEAQVANSRINQIAGSTTLSATDAQQQFQAALSAGVNAALTATRLSPDSYQSWLALGGLYSQAVPLKLSGAYDSAKTAYEKAQALSPTNAQIPYIIAQLDIAHGDTKAAQDDLKSAIALKQDYTAAIFLLSQLEVQDGNVKDALASAEAAAYFTPNNPSILFQVGILRAAQNDLPGARAALEAAVAANPQFANARYFLAAVYAKQGDLQDATSQLKAIADLSAENASAVASQLATLAAGKNPFPANLLTISPAPVGQ